MSDRGRERSMVKKDAFRLTIEYTKELLEPYQIYAVSRDIVNQFIAESKARVRQSNRRFSRLHKVASVHCGNLGLGRTETIFMKSGCKYLINKQDNFAILHRITDSRGVVTIDANLIITIDEAQVLTELRNLPEMGFKLKYHRFN